VIGALIASQAQQSAGDASGSSATGQATNSSGAATTTGQTTTSANSSSGPQTMQGIAGQFDLQNITYQQEQQLEGDLVSSGALTQQDGQQFLQQNALTDQIEALHLTLVNGQIARTAASPPSGGWTDLNTLNLPPDNLSRPRWHIRNGFRSEHPQCTERAPINSKWRHGLIRRGVRLLIGAKKRCPSLKSAGSRETDKSSGRSKNIGLRRRANQWLFFARSAPDQEGRFAIVTDVERGMRWMLGCERDEYGAGRTAKSCGSGIPMLMPSWPMMIG
jgi:hypothetical protein